MYTRLPTENLALRSSIWQTLGFLGLVLTLVFSGKGNATTLAHKPVTGICGAAAGGDLKKVKAFVVEDQNAIRELDNDWTPLHWAASYGRLEVAEFLLKNGADVSGKRSKGYTPLHAAAFERSPELVTLLIANGADVNAMTEDGFGVLDAACSNWSNGEVVRLLLNAGANPNIKGKDGVTPLQKVAWRESAQVLKILLDGGAEIDQAGFEGATALHWAIEGDNIEAALLLAERGADGNARTKKGSTAIKLAKAKVAGTGFETSLKWKRVVRMLIENARSTEVPTAELNTNHESSIKRWQHK